jgi:IS30 family transposase
MTAVERQQRYRANLKPRKRRAARARARLAKLLTRLAIPELEAFRADSGMTWAQVLDV